MRKYSIEILGNVGEGRTEAEVCCPADDGSPGLVALVYENGDGWQLELDTHSVGRTREEEFGLALALARKTLQRYV
ncbi:MAG: hypothetical protein V3R73_00100, partial [Sphingomonadales bacterium]